MKFRYQATDSRGDLRRGNINADSESTARQQIESKGWSVVSLNSDELPKQSAKPNQNPAARPTTSSSAQAAGLVVTGFLGIGLLIFGLNSRSVKPARSKSSQPQLATKKVVIQGVLPAEPIDAIHLTCLGPAVQIDPDLSKLGKPGQSFITTIEVPRESGEIVLEISRSSRRWVVSRTASLQDPTLINLPPLPSNTQLAVSSKPYQSHFAPLRAAQLQEMSEYRRSNDERLRRDNEFAKQRGLPVRNTLR